MNEPQLSAEMEKRFDEEFTVAEIWGMPLPNHNDRKIIYEDEALNAIKEHNKKVKHFLATALEEQEEKHRERRTKWAFKTVGEVEKARKEERAKILSEVESWLVDEEYPITDPDSIDYGMMLASPKNEWNEELRTKLNQLKEGE